MRDGDWKVLAKLNIGKVKSVNTKNEAKIKSATLSDVQIFKISEDVGESNDLSAALPEKRAELTQRLEYHYQELVKDSHVWDR